MELELHRFSHRPGLNKGLDRKILSGFSFRKTIFDTTVFYYLVKFPTQKVTFVNKLFSEHLVFSFSRSL